MRVPIFQLDAFTDRRFSGNPAAVMLLEEFPPDDLLRSIAAENNLPETAFLVKAGADYRLRWFTPTTEVPLCGHATLASAAVVFERLEPGRGTVLFHSASGPLTVSRSGSAYVMDLPARACTPVDPPEGLERALGTAAIEFAWDGFNFIARLSSASLVRALAPDLREVERLPCAGVIVTAADGPDHDFVSRYFAPAKGIPEDPVTGGAHCALTPFWAERLGKTAFRAFQASLRGGELRCSLRGDRVELDGSCVFFLEGEAEI